MVIKSELSEIINRLRIESSYYLRDVENKGDYIRCTCPFHKNGVESHPSCSVYARTDNDKIPYGTYNCFTCHESGTLPRFVSQCLNLGKTSAEDWLVKYFGTENQADDMSDVLNALKPKAVKQQKFLDESILSKYEYYHPYMWKRKLTKEIVDRFNVGYDNVRDAITFPVFDKYHRLVMITERCVNSKKFYIDENVNKPVYLLYDIVQHDYPFVVVTESQINCLTAWSYGYPAIALFGTGSEYQYEILKKCNIRKYVLCFDGDHAGRKGADRFIRNIGSKNIYKDILMPAGKDLNDLSKDEFDKIFKETKNFFLINY